MFKMPKTQRAIKRLLDFVISAVLLAILSLPLCILSILIRMESRGNVLFRQERIGKGGVPFILYKFRSMREEEGSGSIHHDANRVTKIGKFMRKWRIDEIPQLLNVLKGDMSIVGPRPTLAYQVERYDENQARRLTVRPGITGWSQINGDKAISWPERIELDLWYIENWSIWLDMKIMLKTPFALLRIRRINVEEAPAPDEISAIRVENIDANDIGEAKK